MFECSNRCVICVVCVAPPLGKGVLPRVAPGWWLWALINVDSGVVRCMGHRATGQTILRVRLLSLAPLR